MSSARCWECTDIIKALILLQGDFGPVQAIQLIIKYLLNSSSVRHHPPDFPSKWVFSCSFLYVTSFKVQGSREEHLTGQAWYLTQLPEVRRKVAGPFGFHSGDEAQTHTHRSPQQARVWCWAAKTCAVALGTHCWKYGCWQDGSKCLSWTFHQKVTARLWRVRFWSLGCVAAGDRPQMSGELIDPSGKERTPVRVWSWQ